MDRYIAYCGLDCESCEARLATIHNDDALRERVAKLWSKLNGVEITPDMIHCVGCRLDGVKTPYCDSLCPIRQCAAAKAVETCGDCPDRTVCPDLHMVVHDTPQARKNLGMA